jgi:hypothetical protein
MAKRRKSRAEIEAIEFGSIISDLLRVRHADWDDYDIDWLLSNAQRPPDFEYTDKQWAILKCLVARTKTFMAYAGYTVSELIAIVYPLRKIMNEDGEEFIETLHRWRAVDLKVRQIRRLAALCIAFAGIPRARDAEVEAAARETYVALEDAA